MFFLRSGHDPFRNHPPPRHRELHAGPRHEPHRLRQRGADRPVLRRRVRRRALAPARHRRPAAGLHGTGADGTGVPLRDRGVPGDHAHQALGVRPCGDRQPVVRGRRAPGRLAAACDRRQGAGLDGGAGGYRGGPAHPGAACGSGDRSDRKRQFQRRPRHERRQHRIHGHAGGGGPARPFAPHARPLPGDRQGPRVPQVRQPGALSARRCRGLGGCAAPRSTSDDGSTRRAA